MIFLMVIQKLLRYYLFASKKEGGLGVKNLEV